MYVFPSSSASEKITSRFSAAKPFDSSTIASPLLNPSLIDKRIAAAKQKAKDER